MKYQFLSAMGAMVTGSFFFLLMGLEQARIVYQRFMGAAQDAEFSQTVLLSNLYINPQNSAKTADGSHLANVTDQEMQEHYDNFFEDVFVECEDKYGQVGAVENFSPCAYYTITLCRWRR